MKSFQKNVEILYLTGVGVPWSFVYHRILWASEKRLKSSQIIGTLYFQKNDENIYVLDKKLYIPRV